MTIRRGMSGDAVKRIEEALASLELYSGPIDSIFGSGLEAAVENFQARHQVSSTGLVDAETWALLLPGDPAPVSPLAGAPLAERCLALTGSFETGQYPPDCFCAVAGDFDGMGLSFGVLQWNVGQGSLQPILQQMFSRYADVSREIFQEHFEAVKALGSDDIAEQLAFCRLIQSKGKVCNPWLGMLMELGRSAECQSIQAEQAAGVFDRAIAYCGEFEVNSERAVALFFDVVTQNGSIEPDVKARILSDFARLPSGSDEVARLCIIANRVAEKARPEFVEDVRSRKLTVAEGGGMVHGLAYDLADMYCITLEPWSPTGPTPDTPKQKRSRRSRKVRRADLFGQLRSS